MASAVETILSASLSGISNANSSSKAITSSTVSRLSRPRSVWKLAVSLTCSEQTGVTLIGSFYETASCSGVQQWDFMKPSTHVRLNTKHEVHCRRIFLRFLYICKLNANPLPFPSIKSACVRLFSTMSTRFSIQTLNPDPINSEEFDELASAFTVS